ncbi:MAG: hypothetical protein IJI41_03265 [Anaerolineaceae bacterium]|nr:hypothetical protein [Anaerolineaceae bacterium]
MSISGKINKILWILKNKQEVLDLIVRNYYKTIEHKNDYMLIQNSEYFDEEYFKRNNLNLSEDRSLISQYIDRNQNYYSKDPSEFFCGEEYLLLNPDVEKTGINPLLYFEKFGRSENREISLLQVDAPVFPDGTESAERTFPRNEPAHQRMAVVSCFFADGKVPDTLLILLRGLKDVADNIILVGDCPVFPSELEKLNGYVCYAKFKRHMQYDFGSYKRGFFYARETGILDQTKELLFLNDSCYGPIYPFPEVFTKMAESNCDFWGMSGHIQTRSYKSHISSYFMLFRESIIRTKDLDTFLDRVRGSLYRNKVIVLLETELTNYLHEKGFTWDTYCKDMFVDGIINPLSMAERYRNPLIKKKAFSSRTTEDINAVLALIRENNPELAEYITIQSCNSTPIHNFKPPSIKAHQNSFQSKINALSAKKRDGKKLRILFLISDFMLFFSKKIFDALLYDSDFDVFLSVIPDLRLTENHMVNISSQENLFVRSGVPADRLLHIDPDELNHWPDICEDMDIVCYNTPYGFSSFRYLPKYANGRDFLPIMFCDEVLKDTRGSRVLRLDSFRYVWKVFFTDQETLNEYKKTSIDQGTNGEYYGDFAADPKCVQRIIREIKNF